MQIFYLTAGLIILFDGASYFFSCPGSAFRKWLSERRERKWMKIWPPAQWALDSEKARLVTGIIQTLLGAVFIAVYFISN